MKSIRRPLFAFSLTAVSSALAPACVDNNATLFIAGVQHVAPPECTASSELDGNALLFRGRLDVAFGDRYEAALLVGNQYTPRGDKDNLKAETTRVRLQGAEIKLTDTEGRRLIPDFSVIGNGFVNSSSSEEAGYGSFLAELIPPVVVESVGAALPEFGSRTVVATVRVFGETTGGQEIESGDFSFAVDLCNGCSVAFPADAMDLSLTTPTCGANVEKSLGSTSCVPGVDGVVDCRECYLSRQDICERPTAAP